MENIQQDIRGRKTVLITGGAKGIGLAISERLAADGWNLILCGRDRRALDAVALQLQSAHHVNVLSVPVDLSETRSVENLFNCFQSTHGLPRAMICNAGDYGTLGQLANVDIEQWKKSFDLNFFSVAGLVQQYLARALQGSAPYRRKIVVMGGSGLGGAKVWGGISAYACAKAALNRLVEVVHEEVYSKGIDINCMAPGAVKTGITQQAAAAGEEALGPLYQSTLKVLSEGGDSPQFVADAMALLLSESCDGISGRLISAKWDKGFLANPTKVIEDPDLLRLRRIDNQLFQRL